MVIEETASGIVTVWPAMIVTRSLAAGIVPPQVDGLFQSPLPEELMLAANVEKGSNRQKINRGSAFSRPKNFMDLVFVVIIKTILISGIG